MDCHIQFLTVLLDTSTKAQLIEDCNILAFQFEFIAENVCPTLSVDLLIVSVFSLQMANKTQNVNSRWSLLWGRLCVSKHKSIHLLFYRCWRFNQLILWHRFHTERYWLYLRLYFPYKWKVKRLKNLLLLWFLIWKGTKSWSMCKIC